MVSYIKSKPSKIYWMRGPEHDNNHEDGGDEKW
jgi:hypothetical protein